MDLGNVCRDKIIEQEAVSKDTSDRTENYLDKGFGVLKTCKCQRHSATGFYGNESLTNELKRDTKI